MIVVEPVGGLGNRMRAMSSAVQLARESSVPVTVVWTLSPMLNCPFGDLFQPLDDVEVVHRRALTHRLRWRVARAVGVYSRVIQPGEMDRLVEEGSDLRSLASERRILIQTHNPFHPADFNDFEPVAELREAIDDVTQMFGTQTIGVHIRRGDHLIPRRHSPTSAFIERMQVESARDKRVNFFLATDDPQEELALKSVFGKRVMTRSKIVDRASAQGVRDALVDLYCLASTTRIIGSYYSSFTDVAAAIGGAELVVVDVGDAS